MDNEPPAHMYFWGEWMETRKFLGVAQELDKKRYAIAS